MESKRFAFCASSVNPLGIFNTSTGWLIFLVVFQEPKIPRVLQVSLHNSGGKFTTSNPPCKSRACHHFLKFRCLNVEHWWWFISGGWETSTPKDMFWRTTTNKKQQHQQRSPPQTNDTMQDIEFFNALLTHWRDSTPRNDSTLIARLRWGKGYIGYIHKWDHFPTGILESSWFQPGFKDKSSTSPVTRQYKFSCNMVWFIKSWSFQHTFLPLWNS